MKNYIKLKANIFHSHSPYPTPTDPLYVTILIIALFSYMIAETMTLKTCKKQQ